MTSLKTAVFYPRFLTAFALFLGGGLLALGASGIINTGPVMLHGAEAKPVLGLAERFEIPRAVSQDKDLRDLPFIERSEREEAEVRHTRHPFPRPSLNQRTDAIRQIRIEPQPAALSTPSRTFDGQTSANAGCGGCSPPDTNGDVGPNHYIQSVNTAIRIFDKNGAVLANTTYDSFFSALGTSTPCGTAGDNDGDGFVFYDHIADRWVVSDFAFPATGGPTYQCVGVSKTNNPVSGGWWLYALQIDPSNPTWLGDYPKFGLWPDAYYLAVNLFTNDRAGTFEGVRVFALPRATMLNGGGAPNPGAVAFTISPATLGDVYSLVPATFRTGTAPAAGTPEYFMAINSSSTAGTTETQVFTWRFHVDFTTPANSTFGLGASHAPNGSTTVTGFVEALTGSTTDLVPQTSTTQKLDTLGDKIMTPLVYQNLGGTESLWASHTVNNNSGGTGPTAIRWYQFNVTGGTIPSTPAQQQTFNNGNDGLWRWMPSIALDGSGNMAINYSVSSSSTNPAIRYAGRLAADAASTLGQGEAVFIQGNGHQTGSDRWGDYSALSIDPSDNSTFWMTNEYYSTTSSSGWNTRIGTFNITGGSPTPTPTPTATPTPTPTPTPPPGTTISLTALGTAACENFDTLASSGTSSTTPTGWAFSETGTNANTTYTAGTGSSSSGDTYSFGATSSTDRAFGGLRSGSLVPTIGAAYTNNTGGTIASLLISYTGEQWRLGALSRTDQLDFQVSTSATSLTTGTWTDVNALDFVAPVQTGSVGALDGNAAANRRSISSTITGLSIPSGATFWIRWTDLDATGADDGLAIDDFCLTPNGALPTPTPTPTPQAPAITNGPPPSPVIVGSPYTFSFTASGNPAPTFSLAGTLPPGLGLSGAGVLSGTATSGGTGTFSNITVTASNGVPPDATQTFSLTTSTLVANYLAGFGLTGSNAVLTFDYDSDGMVNLLEYALSLDPTTASVLGLPVVTLKDYSGTKYLSILFHRSSLATDLTYIVETSGDLTNPSGWTSVAMSSGGSATTGTGFVTETGSAPNFTVETRDTVPYDGNPLTKRFLRLRVTSP